ncbi:MAG TPA: NAD(P)/FAD-dependent oxidoreductase [Solirubrobacteraceae bacterium]|jgi:cyclohexanone monooxygenase|nr:NAD(P)/FAD-dependent oxidoreductase [Solirubrobacteraceae bacterium]
MSTRFERMRVDRRFTTSIPSAVSASPSEVAASASAERAEAFDVIVVGAGFAGLYALYRLRAGGLSVRVFEQGAGIGGTWFWNRYPGARCDVDSVDYSYSFSEDLEQEWTWTERYPAQAEILRYLEHVAERFDLRRDIELNARVASARFLDAQSRWRVTLADGRDVVARHVVMATGCLSSINPPRFDGLDRFAGPWFHTARWPTDGVELSGKRVGIIGTGSTAIQAIPQLAKQASHLFVFQRTPNFSVPAHNAPLSAEESSLVKASYRERRRLSRESQGGLPATHPDVALTRSALELTPTERAEAFERGWRQGGIPGLLFACGDTLTSADANELVAEFVRAKIRTAVGRPGIAELLVPTDHPIGTKRICVDIDYYETYNRDNVTLVDVRQDPIEEITKGGVRTARGEYQLDLLVLATGFDAMTGSLRQIEIVGCHGERLAEKWASGPRTYLGLACAGFPNLFIVTGPGSPSVISNMVVSIEQHVEWISDCIAHLAVHDLSRIEATIDAENSWVEHVNDVAAATLYPRAESWYVGANVPGKPRVFMPYVGGVGAYRAICDRVRADGYDGFKLGEPSHEHR